MAIERSSRVDNPSQDAAYSVAGECVLGAYPLRDPPIIGGRPAAARHGAPRRRVRRMGPAARPEGPDAAAGPGWYGGGR